MRDDPADGETATLVVESAEGDAVEPSALVQRLRDAADRPSENRRR